MMARLALCAAATAHAEGWWVPGSLPRRNHNPGDLLDGHGVNRPRANVVEGWMSLCGEWRWIFSGQSHVYRHEMTWRRVAELWTGGDNAEGWCAAFCEDVGVDPDSTVAQFLGPQQQPAPAPADATAGVQSPPAQPDSTAT